jgi:DNA-binding NarL/FixJ family response regulator
VIRVLLVDDNDPLREALAEVLDDRGIVVVGQAIDGKEGCLAAVELEPDVVVMDIRMPDMSGLEATAWLGRHRPGIRVVGLTAYDDQPLREAMERAGASEVLVKGASIRQIVDAIAAAGSVPR